MPKKKIENDWGILEYKIDSEGFDYCFDGYSDWEDIIDDEFHKLRQNYLNAKKELDDYINKMNHGE